MGARNTSTHFGWVARGLHWVMALVIVGMFGLGLWMRGLDYYDPWYQRAPDLHISIGVLLIGALVLRIVWRVINTQPAAIGDNVLEHRAASLAHLGLYALLIAITLTGYIYATAEGRPADVFGWFQVPSILNNKAVRDVIGVVHEYLAYGIIALASLHALAALKHHFLDRDATLTRMLRGGSSSELSPQQKSKETTS